MHIQGKHGMGGSSESAGVQSWVVSKKNIFPYYPYTFQVSMEWTAHQKVLKINQSWVVDKKKVHLYTFQRKHGMGGSSESAEDYSKLGSGQEKDTPVHIQRKHGMDGSSESAEDYSKLGA